eukprot:CAMPEP_0176003502 /NCGR_PEP_ID=MMETSP0120_2-20121206/1206_1 /TAXON_ID=160619 /ORGANISM="Kryptoperidinium foliaceum, Strain CCMP 1326" /LENGTH=371 /DNA_ID=CAMNT_0017336145 /DNA_START=224 /DNA_END=1336 /DNA_ORIENTATION=+
MADHLRIKIANSIAKEERRAKERQAPTREICSGCNRPPVLCLCEALPKTKLKPATTILILQHPNEHRKKTFSTVPLLSLVLDNVYVKVGYRFDLASLPLLKEFVDSPEGLPLLLFPSDRAITLEDFSADFVADGGDSGMLPSEIDSGKGNLLILLDGTWAEAKRMALQSPELVKVCQHVTFTSDKPCLYDAVRKEPESHCYSTLEACARALEILEEDGNAQSGCLEKVLKYMVRTKLDMEASRYDDPRQKGRKRDRRMRHRMRIEQALFEKPEPRVIDEFGFILRPLTVEDAPVVNSNWYHRSAKSLSTIESRLAKGVACFGIECDGKLIAIFSVAKMGVLGMLHVDEEFQGRGYGELLIREASLVLGRAG